MTEIIPYALPSRPWLPHVNVTGSLIFLLALLDMTAKQKGIAVKQEQYSFVSTASGKARW